MRPAETSFTIVRPASSAAAATAAFVVSMLTGTPGLGASQALDHRQHPAQLLGVVDRLGAGPGRLAADVEHVGARRHQREAVGDRGVGVEEAAAVGERVGGDVHDAHHRGALPRRRPTRRTSDGRIPGSASAGGTVRLVRDSRVRGGSRGR